MDENLSTHFRMFARKHSNIDYNPPIKLKTSPGTSQRGSASAYSGDALALGLYTRYPTFARRPGVVYGLY